MESHLQLCLMVVLRGGNEEIVVEGGEGVGEPFEAAELVEAPRHRVDRLAGCDPDSYAAKLAPYVGVAAREDDVELGFHRVKPFMRGARSSRSFAMARLFPPASSVSWKQSSNSQEKA